MPPLQFERTKYGEEKREGREEKKFAWWLASSQLVCRRRVLAWLEAARFRGGERGRKERGEREKEKRLKRLKRLKRGERERKGRRYAGARRPATVSWRTVVGLEGGKTGPLLLLLEL